MARYLLDTNIVSYLVDSTSPFHEAVYTELAALSDADEVTLSILSLYELHHWFAYDPAQQGAVAEVIRDFRLLPLAESGAELFGALMRGLRSSASRHDVQRSAIDCMIAVTALEHQARLVSHDAIFGQVAQIIPSLELVSWTGR